MAISRSKWDSFIKCPLCFYLLEKNQIKPPSTPGHPINSRVDSLLKEEFDELRAKGEPHPIFKEYNLNFVPYNGLDPETLKKYRFKRSGVRAKSKKTGIEIFGALDDLWLDKDTDEIVVLDYKALGVCIFVLCFVKRKVYSGVNNCVAYKTIKTILIAVCITL